MDYETIISHKRFYQHFSIIVSRFVPTVRLLKLYVIVWNSFPYNRGKIALII